MCLNNPMVEGEEEDFQWKLEPWTTGFFTEKQPAVRNSFLEHWLTTCNPIPNQKVLHYVSTGIRWDRDWAPIQSLIARLDRLEQLDFITQNEFTGGMAEAISHYHPNCKVILSGDRLLHTACSTKKLEYNSTHTDYGARMSSILMFFSFRVFTFSLWTFSTMGNIYQLELKYMTGYCLSSLTPQG